MKNEMQSLGFDERQTVKPFERLSPSRYVALQTCLLREVWSASGKAPLLPSSPLGECGSIIHRLLEVAGRGNLNSGNGESIETIWDELVSKTERRMALSPLKRHQVPLNRSIPDFEVRKLRACRRAAEIANIACRSQEGIFISPHLITGFEVWVESDDGKVGGFIDRVTMTKAGIVLSEYKSGAVLDSEYENCPGELKHAFKVQLELYAALYWQKTGIWPTRLEIVPLQGNPIEVLFDSSHAKCLLEEAKMFLRSLNERLAAVDAGNVEIAELASPQPNHCWLCLFRPTCSAYWSTRHRETDKKWPDDVQGVLRESTISSNGKVCLRITEGEATTTPYITIRNLTNSTDRHPFLHGIPIGRWVAVYGLRRDYRSGEYIETQNTVIFENL